MQSARCFDNAQHQRARKGQTKMFSWRFCQSSAVIGLWRQQWRVSANEHKYLLRNIFISRLVRLLLLSLVLLTKSFLLF
jgi:hypothetical protein